MLRDMTVRKISQYLIEATFLFAVDAWSQYDNPEEGAEREGDIHEPLQSRKTTTTDKNLLWPDGVVKYYVHSSIGE